MDQDLEEYLDAVDDDMLDGVETATSDTLDNFLRRLGRLEKRMAENSRKADKARGDITQWETMVNSPLQDEAKWVRGLIEGFVEEQRKKDPKAKTFPSPHGVVKTTPAPKRYVYEDERAFIDWALKNDPALLKTTHAPKKDEVKKTFIVTDGQLVTFDGEPVPGIVVRDPEVPFNTTIKPY
jgi:hypothetical protein